jgi:hypothetical protein
VARSELRLAQWPIDRLIEHVRNPRKNDHAIYEMAAWTEEFGFRIPCVAQSDGRLVDGYSRLTPTQIKAFRLLANRSATWAEWDDDLLRLEVVGPARLA